MGGASAIASLYLTYRITQRLRPFDLLPCVATWLLASTIVWCGGEFGRTPKVDTEAPWNGGRGHWGKVFSTLVAGGGFKGGRVVGSSDAKGEEVKTRPVYPRDLVASMYQLLGIDAGARLPHPEGLDTFALPTAADGVPSAGLLKELL